MSPLRPCTTEDASIIRGKDLATIYAMFTDDVCPHLKGLLNELIREGGLFHEHRHNDNLTIQDLVSLLPGRRATGIALYHSIKARHCYIIPPRLLQRWYNTRDEISRDCIAMYMRPPGMSQGALKSYRIVYIQPFHGRRRSSLLALCVVSKGRPCDVVLIGAGNRETEIVADLETFKDSLTELFDEIWHPEPRTYTWWRPGELPLWRYCKDIIIDQSSDSFQSLDAGILVVKAAWKAHTVSHVGGIYDLISPESSTLEDAHLHLDDVRKSAIDRICRLWSHTHQTKWKTTREELLT